MAIIRSNPDVGYIADTVFKAFGFTQNVRAGNTLYMSGIAPIKAASVDTIELVGEGDIRAQVEWCTEVLKRLLEAEGLSPSNVVSTILYTTDVGELMAKAADVPAQLFGGDTPASTLIGVTSLFLPGQMVEIQATAVFD